MIIWGNVVVEKYFLGTGSERPVSWEYLVNTGSVGESKDNFGRPVEAGLDVSVDGLVFMTS